MRNEEKKRRGNPEKKQNKETKEITTPPLIRLAMTVWCLFSVGDSLPNCTPD